ncbi:MAG: hypothetical protein UT76_C0021G0008 [Candidatus Woesebacteria bacterium GW2011_GWB1_40_12]|nr:MAG: hypothetical protein UT76_C0021G0008 [Candidatus Woesebacteria bacterium GW2011_GWB1_40_12]KKS03082.1 MAG: hypothetical protein UU57_C0038G0008 [Candidatus Woesebacteria bacterium GW2011_GWE1_41_24]
MSKCSGLVKAAFQLLTSDKDTKKSGGRIITRGVARKILSEETDRIEARIRSMLPTS